MIGPTVLILDIDGVLIIGPSWKPDSLHIDGYSDFDSNCVQNLNLILKKYKIEIWLSSTRRTTKTLEEFNLIFKNRGIAQKIQGCLAKYPKSYNRRQEIEHFLNEKGFNNFIILDDDKSLNDLGPENKDSLVLTELLKGFTDEKLKEAFKIIEVAKAII